MIFFSNVTQRRSFVDIEDRNWTDKISLSSNDVPCQGQCLRNGDTPSSGRSSKVNGMKEVISRSRNCYKSIYKKSG